MAIKNKELDKIISEHGTHYAKVMYANYKINLTKKQLERLLNEKESKNKNN